MSCCPRCGRMNRKIEVVLKDDMTFCLPGFTLHSLASNIYGSLSQGPIDHCMREISQKGLWQVIIKVNILCTMSYSTCSVFLLPNVTLFSPFLLILSLKTPPLCRWVMLSIHVWLEQHCAIIILHWCTRPRTTLSWTSLLFPQYWAAPRWSNTELLLSLWLLENPHLSKYVLRYVCFYSISWVDVDVYTTV